MSERVAGSDQEVLVNEEAVKQSMELSQRLSKSAIGKWGGGGGGEEGGWLLQYLSTHHYLSTFREVHRH